LEKDREKVISSVGSSSSESTIKETTGGFLKAFTNGAPSLSTSHSNTSIATSSRGKECAQLVSSTSTSSTKTIITQAQQLDPSSSTSIPTSTSSSSSVKGLQIQFLIVLKPSYCT
jgi:hypothetical protein